MTRQRGVKKHPERMAGPYIMLANNERAEYARSSKHIARVCRQPNGHSHRYIVYSYPRVSFGELMQSMRALFRLEREVLGEQLGLPWDAVTISEDDICSETYHRMRGKSSRRVVQAKIMEMLQEARGGVNDSCDPR